MKNKITRLEDLEKKAAPKGKIVVIYEDSKQAGGWLDKDKKSITEADLEKLGRETPGGITILRVVYDRSGVKL